MSAKNESDDEADKVDGAPHPRHATMLVAHRAQERDLLAAFKADRLPHAIILGGPEGIGKATLAWRFARFLVANPDPAAAAEATDLAVAPSSRAAAAVGALSHPDVIVLRREINEKTRRFYSEIRADDVRRAIGLFQRAAGAGGYRICIIDSAEDLNRSSANALLKLIEEPPPRSLFLMIAHRPGLLLPTIRSRAQVLRFAPLHPPEIVEVVASLGAPWVDLPATGVSAAAERAGGSAKTALRLLGQRGVELHRHVAHILDQLPRVDWREVHKLADQTSGRDGEVALEGLLATAYDWIGSKVRHAAGPASGLVVYAEAWDAIAAQAREVDALNLDKRALVLFVFTELAAAARRAA